MYRINANNDSSHRITISIGSDALWIDETDVPKILLVAYLEWENYRLGSWGFFPTNTSLQICLVQEERMFFVFYLVSFHYYQLTQSEKPLFERVYGREKKNHECFLIEY